jgi:hypothetical protein
MKFGNQQYDTLAVHDPKPEWLGVDSVSAFLVERCERKTLARSRTRDVFEAFDIFCARRGLRPLQPHELRARMVSFGFSIHPIRGRSHWRGVKLLPDPNGPVFRTARNG